MASAEVVVRWATVDDLTDEHVALLDAVERERRERLRREDDRARFVLGVALVRHVVAGLDGTAPGEVVLERACPRCGAPHGPVTTPGRPWRVSVSHSGAFAVVAVAAEDACEMVGVDLETRCPPEWRDLLPQVLADGEAAPADQAEFLALWVRKEAVLKATHEGLSRPMSTVRLDAGTLDVTDLDVGDLPGTANLAGALAVAGEGLGVSWQRARI